MMHFESEEGAIKQKLVTRNPYDGKLHVFMMDPSVSLIIDYAHLLLSLASVLNS